MNKKQRHLVDIDDLFNSFPNPKVEENLHRYIVANSNLPSPRANLELAAAFEEFLSKIVDIDSARDFWDLCVSMTSISADKAQVNDPREFVPFCGVRGIGAIGATHAEYRMKTLLQLERHATDSRWRMREAVAMALWKLLAISDTMVRRELDNWIESGNWLVVRGALAGISEPSLLMDNGFAGWALEKHIKVLDRVLLSSNRKSAEFKILRKTLGYTLSVVISAVPEAGFRLLESLLEKNDSDVTWIVRQNLKKNRLMKSFPSEVKTILQRIG